MKVILTGATGLVGEGVLLECLDNPTVTAVLSVSRRAIGRTHHKLTELLVADFQKLDGVREQLTGCDACFYCAGISSRGMSEADYTVITLDTPLVFAKTLLKLNPGMSFVHISGQSTDGTEQGKVMWARVKGKAENALAKLPFKHVVNLRPGLMKPTAGQTRAGFGYRAIAALAPILPFTAVTLSQLGRAMIASAQGKAPKSVLEAADILALVK